MARKLYQKIAKKIGIAKTLNFFNKKIWEEPKNKYQNILYHVLRVGISSIKGFINDNCFDKSSTLTFYTLLSIVPVIAIGFGIAQGLGMGEKFTEQIKDYLSSQPQIAEKLIQFAHSTLKQTEGGIIAAFGLVVLLWTILKMIGNIEFYFDEIWKVPIPRTFLEELKSYLPMIILFPIFLVGSNSIIIEGGKNILQSTSNMFSFLSPATELVIKIIPYLINWIFLCFVYTYLPNTKVSWKAGLAAAVLTGILFQLWQWIYVIFQVNVSSYGAIYGSFAAIPLFLIWLNYSWLILLYGCELCCSIQQNLLTKKSRTAKKKPKALPKPSSM